MDQSQELGAVLQTRREQLRLTLQDLGDAIGCHPSSVMRFERGTRRPSTATLQRLAQELRLPLADLLAVGGYPPENQLPTLRPYLRAYGLDEQTIAEVSAYIANKASQYGAVGMGPVDGEDELTTTAIT